MEMLSGKIAIIAGASSGMGAATAQLFAAQGQRLCWEPAALAR